MVHVCTISDIIIFPSLGSNTHDQKLNLKKRFEFTLKHTNHKHTNIYSYELHLNFMISTQVVINSPQIVSFPFVLNGRFGSHFKGEMQFSK